MTVGKNSWECLQTINDNNNNSATVFTNNVDVAAASINDNTNPSTSSLSSSNNLVVSSSSNVSITNKISSENLTGLAEPTASSKSSSNNLTLSNNNEKSSSSSSSSSSSTTISNSNNSNSNNASHVSTHALGNLRKHMKSAPKSGRNHAGAKYLASQYTKVKRMQEILGISVCLPLIIYNFVLFLYHFDVSKWYFIFFAGCKYNIYVLFIC